MISLINNNKWEEVIKTLGEDINKKIIDGNNILHLASIRGNKEIIEKLEKKLNILEGNNDGNTLLHLLIKNGWNELAIKIAKKYPELIGMINNRGETCILLSIDRIDLFKNIYNLLGNKKIEIIDRISMLNENIILRLINQIKSNNNTEEYYKILQNIIKMGANTDNPIENPPLIYAIEKNYNNIAKMLLEYGTDVNVRDITMYSPINVACSNNNLEIINILIKFGADIEYGGPENDYLPINILINNREYTILNNLKKKIKNFEIKDRYLNTYIHYLLSLKLKNENIPDEIIMFFLNKSRLDIKNIDGVTPLNLLLKLENWKKYMDILEKKDIILNVNDNDTLNDFDDKKYLEMIEKRILNNKPIKLIIDKVPELIPVVELNDMFGLFNSDGIHNVLYTLNMLKKYKELTIPYLKYDRKKHKKDLILLNLQNIPYFGYYKIIYSIMDLYYTYFYEISPHIILWKNKELYNIHPDFEKALKNSFKDNDKRFILIKVTLIASTKGTHANIVLIDKKNKIIRRFEPYGKSDILDGYELDKILYSKIKKCTNDKLKYYSPDEYLDFAKFQTISGDTYDTNKKLGDPIGYCLAWCFWYLELKLNNKDIDEKKLITDTLDEIYHKYKDEDNPYLSYIRGYSKQLNESKNELLKDFGIESKYFYDITPKSKNMKKITKGFAEFISKMS